MFKKLIKTKLGILALSLTLILSIGFAFLSMQTAEAQNKNRFIYIDRTNFTLAVLEGDIDNPASATVVFGPVPVSGPEKYAKYNIDGYGNAARCYEKPGTPGYPNGKGYCPNLQETTYVAPGKYTLIKRGTSRSLAAFGDIAMPFAMLLSTPVSHINIHTYDPNSSNPKLANFRPEDQHYDDWGAPQPYGSYTHGCWALAYENAKQVYNLAFNGMEVRFATMPHTQNGSKNTPTPEVKKPIYPVVEEKPPVIPTTKPTQVIAPPVETPRYEDVPKYTPEVRQPVQSNVGANCKSTSELQAIINRRSDISAWEIYRVPNDSTKYMHIFEQKYPVKYQDIVSSPTYDTYNGLRADLLSFNNIPDGMLWTGLEICLPVYR